MDKNLADLLEKKSREKPLSRSIDWDERRNNYLEAVGNLYRQIETELADSIARKMVMTERRNKEITENYIGPYSVQELILVIGDEQVWFSPRGRNIVGAAGRVDVVGERAEAVLIVQPDSTWAFVQSRQPTLKTIPFDGSTLAEVLQVVMRA